MATKTKDKINKLYIECRDIIGLDLLEIKTLGFLQRLKASSKKGTKAKVDNDTYQLIVEHLNTLTGKTYRWSTASTKAHIRARLNEGFKIDEFKKVIEIKTKQWLTDEKWSRFLRPSTLFGNKFEGYLQEWHDFKRKEENDRQQYIRAKKIESGELQEEDDPEELRKQREWQALSKRLLGSATKEDYVTFYKSLKPMFKRMAFKKGLEDHLIKNLYVQWLKENRSTNYTNCTKKKEMH